ncbi:MAG: anti-sigma factor domain-containing protein [Phycisphaerales bacterium]
MTAMPHNERLFDLLADRALDGLDAAEAMELQRLLAESGDAIAEDELDLAAAALHLGFGVEQEALPEGLRDRIALDADRYVRPSSASKAEVHHEIVRRPDVVARIGWMPWLVAAAAIVIGAVGWMRTSPTATPETPNAAPITAQFASLRDAPGTEAIAWAALEDPTAQGAAGEVIWNAAEQRGFMRFEGLAANDPSIEQYQLWIFDSTRPEATPVDGGVFDISAQGEVIVPIRAKLPVRDAAAFAVTVEQPGGVVVSDRSRLAMLAARG